MKKTYLKPEVDIYNIQLQHMIALSAINSDANPDSPALDREEDFFFGEEVSF